VTVESDNRKISFNMQSRFLSRSNSYSYGSHLRKYLDLSALSCQHWEEVCREEKASAW